MTSLKIALIGPSQGGKTRVANMLANLKRTATYKPTIAVRILEIERDVTQSDQTFPVPIELWDVSGDQRYEQCWPSVCQDCNGVIIVFDSTSQSQTNEVSVWCEWFVRAAALKTGQAQIIALGKTSRRAKPLQVKCERGIVEVPVVGIQVDHEHAPDIIEKEFQQFVQSSFRLHPDANGGGGGGGGAYNDSVDLSADYE